MRKCRGILISCLLFMGYSAMLLACQNASSSFVSPLPTVSPARQAVFMTHTSPLPPPTVSPARQGVSTTYTSPLPPPTRAIRPPSFSIDGPLKPGDKVVRGHGPAGIPILVVDVTLIGEPLGHGVIEEDNSFSIKVSPPLIVNHRIGLQLGELSQVGIEPSEAKLEQMLDLAGEESMNLPRIGILLTTKLVRPLDESTLE